MAEENLRRYCVCVTKQKQDANDKAALLNEARWNIGDVIRVRFIEGDQSLKNRVRAVAERWTAPGMANLKLQWVDSGAAEIRIAFQQGNGSWSYLGTHCRAIPEPQPTMNYGWLTPASSDDELRSVVLHEFGHALGLIHQHQSPQGGIKWNEPAVFADLSGPPNNWDAATIRSNVLDHYSANQVTASPVDRLSIMMNPIPRAWTLDGFSAGMNNDLSQDDIRVIKLYYP